VQRQSKVSIASGGMRSIHSSVPAARRSDPYCAFKDDRQRFRALVSRDLRIAFVSGALAYACVNGHISLDGLLLWLRQLAG
jgi:hypothetical protein